MGDVESGRACLNLILVPDAVNELCLPHYLSAKRNYTCGSGGLLVLWVNPVDPWTCVSVAQLSCGVPDWKRAAYPHGSGNAALGWKLQNKIAQRSY